MRAKFLAAGVCTGLLALVSGVVPATAGAGGATQATVFQAFTAGGKPTFTTRSAKGYCWTGSIAADRSDAWRCFVDNYIHDPCFSSTSDPGHVACPNPGLRKGLLVKLTRKLPHKYADQHTASVDDRPWLVQTANGRRWLYATGATASIGGRRANYFRRGSNAALWGLPHRQVEPWRIYWGTLSAKHLRQKVAIRHAWM
jgi:hypothetical protein